jgi:predicted kinase
MTKKITLMVGESGSGKSTIAKSMLDKDTLRVNRDSIRKMLFEKWNARYEAVVEKLEFEAAKSALEAGYNVIVDDLNINSRTRTQWENFAKTHKAEFVLHQVDTPLEECIRRDRLRTGRDRVGQSVITKQFIRNGRPNVFEDIPTVLVDVDGTLADFEGIRSAFDESRVKEDRVHYNIAMMVNKLREEGNQIIIVSGRHEDCGPDTEDWLLYTAFINIISPFHGLLMRNRGDNKDDRVVKKELLDLILKYVSKPNIKLVIDDRPKVCRMWQQNDLTVFWARGEDIEDF